MIDIETGEIMDDPTYAELVEEVICLRAEVVRLHKLAYFTIRLPWRRKRSQSGRPNG